MKEEIRRAQDKALVLYQRLCFGFLALVLVDLLAGLFSLFADEASLGFACSFVAYLRKAMFETTYGYGIVWNYVAYVISLLLVTVAGLFLGLRTAKAKVRVEGSLLLGLYLADCIYCFVIAGGASYPCLEPTAAYLSLGLHILGLILVVAIVISYLRLYFLFRRKPS